MPTSYGLAILLGLFCELRRNPKQGKTWPEGGILSYSWHLHFYYFFNSLPFFIWLPVYRLRALRLLATYVLLFALLTTTSDDTKTPSFFRSSTVFDLCYRRGLETFSSSSSSSSSFFFSFCL
ncbi:hypothetical protein V8C37DRAFT_386536 [Trichoderma ceciliae]